jgi:serine/threonine protein kinase
MGKDAYLFEVLKEHIIGEGGFAYVFIAIRKHDQKRYAIKRSKISAGLLDEREKEAFNEEIRLMKENPHPLIVKVIDDFLDNAGHICMV